MLTRIISTASYHLIIGGYGMARAFVEVEAKPVLTVAAAILLKELTRRKAVWEFGSGGSTLWFAGFVKSLVSIEDDRVWYDAVKTALSQQERITVDYRFVETKKLPDSITDAKMYDVVFVDCLTQNERRRSIILGARHVKPGGWLVADDYDFPMTHKAIEDLRGAGWDVGIVSGIKTHPIKRIQVKTSTAFCYKREG